VRLRRTRHLRVLRHQRLRPGQSGGKIRSLTSN
jgi:hypothetical protein